MENINRGMDVAFMATRGCCSWARHHSDNLCFVRVVIGTRAPWRVRFLVYMTITNPSDHIAHLAGLTLSPY